MFKVTYVRNGQLNSKDFAILADAGKAYEKIARYNNELPRKLESITVSRTGVESTVIQRAHNWGVNSHDFAIDALWRDEAKSLLKGLTNRQFDSLFSVPVKELKNMVVSNNVSALCELKYVGEATAKKIVRTLRKISKIEKTKVRASKVFTRVTINNGDGDDFVIDEINKAVSPVERAAIELGGNDAIIHVVSWIKDPDENDVDEVNRAEHLSEVWREKCFEGMDVNGKHYVPLGHGTNAAKEDKTIWVLSSIYAEMRAFCENESNSTWKTTAAKKIAYQVGLKSVATKPVRVPIRPEEVLILDDVEDEITVNVVKEFLDGHEEQIDNYKLSINRTDGFMMIHTVERMKAELYNRLCETLSPEEADSVLRTFVNNTSGRSYRCLNANVKGFGCQHFDWHEFLHDNGVHSVNGKNIDDYVIIMFKSVLKCGPGGAYRTLQEWIDSVGNDIGLSVCVSAHPKQRKNVSYQVVQSLTEASDADVRGMASKTIDYVNNLHTVDGASHVVNRELGTVMRMMPSLVNVPYVKEHVAHAIETNINDSFGGKLMKACYYAFIMPDPVWVLQKAFGLEVTGCVKAGEIHVGGLHKGEYVMWRSPDVHPNSTRVVSNVAIAKEYRKYFINDEFVIMMNCFDDLAVAFDADFDGDHANVSDDENMISAAKATLKRWNRLVVWETPNTEKRVITREEELEYFANLTHRNELGLTVYGLNALLNGIIWKKDPMTNEWYQQYIGINERGVNFKKFAANVLVDASKHGGATINEPVESSRCSKMLQPCAKTYRDAVDDGKTKEELDALTVGYKSDLMKSTLNRLFAMYAKYMDRSLTVHDAPSFEFDFHKIMFDSTEEMRGLVGLTRKGRTRAHDENGNIVYVDQGLFESLARRIDSDRASWEIDRKDKDDTSFEDSWRVNALAEIEEFANGCGRTLKDAYDVITYKMFRYCDASYQTMDGSMDWLRNQLWRAYVLVFGGMMVEAAEENLGFDVDVDEDYPI